MTLNERANDLVDMLKKVEEATKPLLADLKDITLPLSERWEAYILLVEKGVLTADEMYGNGNIHVMGDNFTLYDDFQMERHETKTFVEIYQHVMEAEGEYEENLVEFRSSDRFAEWQEAVLKAGYASFTYDW